MCAYYKTESANVKSRWACYFPLDKLEEMYNNNVKVIPNNQADCEVISKYIYRLLTFVIQYPLYTFYAPPPKELWEAYSNHTVRSLCLSSVPLRVQCISPIFFEVGIPNFCVWMHLGMAKCHIPSLGHCILDL